jgi:hypothetical protein
MSQPQGEPSQAADRLDPLAELDALTALGRRAPGSDAERRAARHLEERLAGVGRTAVTEPFAIHPAWPVAYAVLAALAVAGSTLSVSVPLAGVGLAAAGALLTFLDAGALTPTLRRLLGRRASQNVVSWGGGGKPGALVLVAHYDAGRSGLAMGDRARRVARGGLAPLLWAELAVLACCLLRLIGLDGGALTIVQFVPTLALLAAIGLLIDVALAGTKGGENDNGSGVVVVLRLAGHELEHFDLHVLLTGANKAGVAGMRAFLKRHADRLEPDRTVFVGVDEVGAGEVRFARREGALVTIKAHQQLLELAGQIVEDGAAAEPLVSRRASDAYAARAAGFPALTITCRERRDYAPSRVDERAMRAAEDFCAELIERIDAEIGPALSELEEK